MEFIEFLILFPFLIAGVLAVTQNNTARKTIVYLSGGIIIAAAIALAVSQLVLGSGNAKTWRGEESLIHIVDYAMLAVEAFLMVLVVILSIKHRKYYAGLLSVIGTVLVGWFELSGRAVKGTANLYCDRLTVVMCLVIAVIGSLICMYAVGYMHDYHHHHTEYKDRRTFFFPMLFVFLGAMFGLVTSSNLIWIYFFWEITSISSFLLIGYTRTKEAVNNSFRALWMNLLGGLGFAAAIVLAGMRLNVGTLQELVSYSDKALILVPVILLAFAAITKSAQMPFSRWLLGAMVAPTPTSALLHSATMVKAGVYLLLRLAPVMGGELSGTMVSVIGGFTFLIASMLAITVSDGKKVLAYSTISNLGLITACAGVGSPDTVWAGVLLLMFHAVSKSMLFQAVGSFENATGSRNIEDMHGLMRSYPRLAIIMVIGIAGMFLAPFGMLISKWAALKAFVDAKNIFLVVSIVFGSATTMLYWTKWLAKILICKADTHKVTHKTPGSEWTSLFTHAALMIVLCVSLPISSKRLIEPLLSQLYSKTVSVLSVEDLIIMVIMMFMIFVVPAVAGLFVHKIKVKPVITYMSGINNGDDRRFIGSFGERKLQYLSNWYMVDYFGEKRIWKPAVYVATALIVIFISLAISTLTGGVI